MVEQIATQWSVVIAQGIVLWAIKRNYEHTKENEKMHEKNGNKLDAIINALDIKKEEID